MLHDPLLLAILLVGSVALWTVSATAAFLFLRHVRKELRAMRKVVMQTTRQAATLASVVSSHAGDPKTAAVAGDIARRIRAGGGSLEEDRPKPGVTEVTEALEFEELWAVECIEGGFVGGDEDQNGNPLDDELRGLARQTYDRLKREKRLPERSAA